MSQIAFIWDLDGTLLDSYGIIVNSVYETYTEFGIVLDKNLIRKEILDQTVGAFLSKIEAVTNISAEAAKRRVSELNDKEKLNIKPMPNAEEILRWLDTHGISNYVFTHKGKSTEAVLKNLGFFDYFSDIITGIDGFPRKPDPSAINHLVGKYGLKKADTFYVGDRILDIECANNAGIKSILFTPPGSVVTTSGKETYVVNDLMDIREIVCALM